MFFLFFLNFISSLQLGLSPSQVYLKGHVDEKICANFSLNSNRNINVIVKSKWSEKESKDIKDYNLSEKEFNIEIIKPERVGIFGKKETEICFIGNKPGNFYSAILFESENGYASVGSWIFLDIEKKNFGITGNVIENLVNSEKSKFFLLALIPEAVILFLLIKKLKSKREKLV
jgi:hypothetical protein